LNCPFPSYLQTMNFFVFDINYCFLHALCVGLSKQMEHHFVDMQFPQFLEIKFAFGTSRAVLHLTQTFIYTMLLADRFRNMEYLLVKTNLYLSLIFATLDLS